MLHNIAYKTPDFPSFISPLAKDFMSKLLKKDPSQRNKFILNKGIKNHPWFDDIGNLKIIFLIVFRLGIGAE